jgi:hypothetical protein
MSSDGTPLDLDGTADRPPVPDADLDIDALPEPRRVDRWVWQLNYDRPPILVNEVSSPIVLGSKRKKVRGKVGADLPSVFHPWGWDLVEIELVWFHKVNKGADPDGMATTLKPLIDALVDCGVLPDDKARHVYRVSQRIVLPRDDPRSHRGPRVLVVVHRLERPEGS